MSPSQPILNARLNLLLEHDYQHLLRGGLKGIEKESLRINPDGTIALTPHPPALGSALTHPCITTDYSEALIELITPAFIDITKSLEYLYQVHQVVYRYLGAERLLCSSMPCGINGDLSIPIANYGTSNIGIMKHVYRKGLWYRYGRTMQAIAGVHFNYSAPIGLWLALQRLENSTLSPEQYINTGYFALIRNFQRVGWLILYLFGASPALCRSFFKSRPELIGQFERFDNSTLYHPYATSLRMSDIGYKSKNQADLKVDYNSLDGYVASLTRAIQTPFSEYEKIGVEVNGEFRQLNSNILQIENEFYSIIRPKQIAESCEKPTKALQRRGVRYIEMRSLDLDIFSPIGISDDTARFVEALLLTCLLRSSPDSSEEDFQINNANQLLAANRGRQPGLLLNQGGKQVPLQDWAFEITESMRPICALLDEQEPKASYTHALQVQIERIKNADLTFSAQLLAQMTLQHQSFSNFAVKQSEDYWHHFKAHRPDADILDQFDSMAELSLAKQAALESKEQLPFADFLSHYFANC